MGWVAACGGNTANESGGRGGSSGQEEGGSAGRGAGSGRGGTAGTASTAGTAGTASTGGTRADAAGGTGGGPTACQRARDAFDSAVERATRCDLSLDRAQCDVPAPGECCQISVNDAAQAEELSLLVAQLVASCGQSPCPENVCPMTPSGRCQSSGGSALGRCQ